MTPKCESVGSLHFAYIVHNDFENEDYLFSLSETENMCFSARSALTKNRETENVGQYMVIFLPSNLLGHGRLCSLLSFMLYVA